MKLLFLNSSLGSGGAERVLSTLANTFAQNGYEVVVATYNGAVEDFYPLEAGVRRAHFGTPLGKNRMMKLFRRLQKLYNLRRLIKKERPDVVLPLIIYTNIEAVIASAGLGVRVLVAEHNNYWAITSRFFRALRLLAYRFADKTVVLTHRDKEIYDRYLDNVEVIGNPIVLNGEPPETEEARLPHLLCVGRLSKVKQFHHAIEAFAMIHEKHSEWRLTIAGEGDKRDVLEATAEKLGVGGKVDLPGNVSDIAGLYRRSGIFVLCSEYEGLPMVIGEAMLSGLPVVSYNCPTGPEEFIDDGVNGLLVTHNDIEELAGKIETLIEDPAMARVMAENARESIGEFSVSGIITKWERLFHKEETAWNN